MVRVLYYYWGEITYVDCVETMRQMGWRVDVITHKINNYDEDSEFAEKFNKCLEPGYDFIFTFDYFPIISKIADDAQVKYVSWVYDSPHLTLESKTLNNRCNNIFLFDYELCKKYEMRGINTIHYMPLAINDKRLAAYYNQRVEKYKHEVTFLGTLYDDENNFLDQIKIMPDKLKGFIDGLMESQLLIYGYDLVEEIFTDAYCDELAKFAIIDMGPQYENCRNDIFRDMIRKKVTILERRRILENVSQRFKVDLYAPKAPDNMTLTYMGYADYVNEMPEIFRTSKINLNITLRSILSGLPLRMQDIMGAGGFLLTNYQKEIPEYFDNERHLVWYESIEDMLDKIRYYLKHDDEREKIAEEGCKRVRELFTYEKQLKKIYDVVK